MVLVIDVQGYLLNDGFVVRGPAISDDEAMSHFVFKPHIPTGDLI